MSLALGDDRLRRVRGVTATVGVEGIHVAAVEATADGEVWLETSFHGTFPGEVSDEHLRPASIVALLAKTLGQAGLGTRLKSLALPEDLFGSSLGIWPHDVPGEARGALLARRIRELVETSDVDLVADCRPTGASEAGDDQAFFVWATEPYMRSFASALASAELSVDNVCPASIAVLDTFAASRAACDADQVELIVCISEPHLFIGVYRGNRPVYVRFLRQVLFDAINQGQTVHAAIVTEVRRTIAFFKENHRGHSIDGVTLHGGPSGLRDVLPAIVGDVPMVRFGSEGAAAADVTLLTLLAVHASSDEPFTLEAARKVRSWRALAGAVVGIVGALAWIGASVMSEQALVAAARDDLAAFEILTEGADDPTDLELALEDLREDAAWTRTLVVAGITQPNPIDHLLEASVSLPAELELLNSSIDHGYGEDLGRRFLRLQLETSAATVAAIDTYVDLLASRPWCEAITSNDTRAQLMARRKLQPVDDVVTADIEVVLP